MTVMAQNFVKNFVSTDLFPSTKTEKKRIKQLSSRSNVLPFSPKDSVLVVGKKDFYVYSG